MIIIDSEEKNTQQSILRKHFEMLYPDKLKDDEWIRLVRINKISNETFVDYIKTYDEYYNYIQTYKWNFDLYNQLATNIGRDKGTESQQRTRRVLFLDFDQKDYERLSGAKAFTGFIKSKIKKLFLHACINSGHGYHYYICIDEKANNAKEVVELNKTLADIFKADLKATLSTQIARIPCSFNHKTEDGEYDYQDPGKWEYVRVVNNAYKNGPQYRAYPLSEIKSYISDYYKNLDKEVNIFALKEWKEAKNGKEFNYFCIERVKHEGAVKGQRNFWHGRIVKSMQKQGYSEQEIFAACKEYNAACIPPKSDSVILDDTARFLKKKYNLTGCYGAFPEDDERHWWVAMQCDEAKCKTFNCGLCITEMDTDEKHNPQRAAGAKINKKILKNSTLRKMTGNDYLVITLIDVYEVLYGRKGFRVRDLVDKLKSKYAKRRCIGDKTLKPLLLNLQEKKWIQIVEDKKKPGVFLDSRLVLTRRLKEIRQGYIEFYFNIARALIDGRIVANEYLVYITLLRNLDNGRPVTYDELAYDLDFSRQNVAKYIKNLEDAGCIFISKGTTDKGFECNKYRVTNPQLFDEIDRKRRKEFEKASVTIADEQSNELSEAILIA